jgi:hypothetical protein
MAKTSKNGQAVGSAASTNSNDPTTSDVYVVKVSGRRKSEGGI